MLISLNASAELKQCGDTWTNKDCPADQSSKSLPELKQIPKIKKSSNNPDKGKKDVVLHDVHSLNRKLIKNDRLALSIPPPHSQHHDQSKTQKRKNDKPTHVNIIGLSAQIPLNSKQNLRNKKL